MKKPVFVHYKDERNSNWQNIGRYFSRVPTVGEYFALSDTGPWYRVEIVVHCPFDDAEFEAEIFGIKVDHLQVLKDK